MHCISFSNFDKVMPNLLLLGLIPKFEYCAEQVVKKDSTRYTSVTLDTNLLGEYISNTNSAYSSNAYSNDMRNSQNTYSMVHDTNISADAVNDTAWTLEDVLNTL